VLNEVRVLDLAAPESWLAGQLLADMGAAVELWERPTAVQVDPFWRQAYASCKLQRRIDWLGDTPRLLAQLEGADVVIESMGESWFDAIGLTRELFAARFPHLIHVTITGFGSTGPKAGWAATDLVASAASGFLYLSGAPDRAPLRIGAPQSFHHAAADAVVAVQIALLERERSGLGQHVDLSAQQSTTYALLNRSLDKPVGQQKAMRASAQSRLGSVDLRSLYPAADGWVMVLQGIVPPLVTFMNRLTEWLHRLGLLDASLLGQPWGQSAMKMATGAITQAQWAPIQEAIASAMASHSKAELMAIAVEHRLLIAPVLSVADVLQSQHAKDRSLVIKRFGIKRLGAFAHLSKTPFPLRRTCHEVWLPRALSPNSGTATGLPLAGVKILDLFWVVAGPGSTRMLADYGATVIHVESSTRVDMVRSVPPYIDGMVDPENAAAHHSTNANKLNLALNLGVPAAREVLLDLVRWADVITESFAPGAAARMGLSWSEVQRLNPRAIMISSCLMGQDGAFSAYAGYGNLAAAVSGFFGLTGWPEEPPTGCFGPYTDFLGVRFNAMAILAALEHRRATGEGQYIDMAQAEAGMNFLAAECARYLSTGNVSRANGNRDPEHVPQGVWRVVGDDRWLALSVRNDADWQALCDVAGDDFLALRGLSFAERKQREEMLESRLTAWLADLDGPEIETRLQSAGVPAHRVLDTHDLFADAQLAHRQHYLRVAHNKHANAWVESTRLTMSRTLPREPAFAPWFGIDNDTVLRKILGYDDGRIAALASAGALK
jgi:crotonobetainyl-CoA:carnitine CoA-transferase CaiB-like acyl-CoA transferase